MGFFYNKQLNQRLFILGFIILELNSMMFTSGSVMEKAKGEKKRVVATVHR
jgi:hypothetical protein